MSKKATHLSTITAEDRVLMQQLAKESREVKRNAASNIMEMADDAHWRELAKSYGVKMPNRFCQSSEVKYVKRAGKKIGVDVNTWVRDVVGAVSLGEVAKMNPNIGAVGMVGLLLEACDEGLLTIQ